MTFTLFRKNFNRQNERGQKNKGWPYWKSIFKLYFKNWISLGQASMDLLITVIHIILGHQRQYIQQFKASGKKVVTVSRTCKVLELKLFLWNEDIYPDLTCTTVWLLPLMLHYVTFFSRNVLQNLICRDAVKRSVTQTHWTTASSAKQRSAF